jgi:Acyl-protein synthetase, LuxE
MFEYLLQLRPFSITAAEKEKLILEGINHLLAHHYNCCTGYRRIVDAVWGGPRPALTLADVPYLPASLFKEIDLSSTNRHSLVLQSSGTTGQRPSRIYVDAETAQRQSRALVATFQPLLGTGRLPFLVIDTKQVIKNEHQLTARGAGVLGMMKFGARATFALDNDLRPYRAAIADFVASNGSRPFLIFGFTFLVWSALYQPFADGELDLSNAMLIHSGGWKRLEAMKVSNEVFRESLKKRFNLQNICSFYGFVEQIGSVFVEGGDGLLYPPNFSDVIIRRPESWEPAGVGEEGVVQVVSLLPTSYPGNSILTEDYGVVAKVDGGYEGRLGKAIRVLGRVPKAELRGCSDVIAAEMAG